MGKNLSEALKIYGPIALLAVILTFVALRFVAPAPPTSIVFAAGSPEGQYYRMAQNYAEALSVHGIQVEILETEGTLENYQHLLDRTADLALLQGGLANITETSSLRSLGGVFPEPFWMFSRAGADYSGFADLKTSLIAAGSPQSGTRAQLNWLKKEWGGDWSQAEFLPLSGLEALKAVKDGTAQLAVFSASIEASYIGKALTDPALTLVAPENIPGLAMRNQALMPLTLHRGVVDLDNGQPAQDTELLVSVAQLGVHEALHPAIQSVLLEAGERLHAGGTLISRAGSFPNMTKTDLPLSDEARRYARNGPTFLRKYFSFGWANFLERAWVFLIPLIAFLIPLVQMAPPLYRWRTRRKIYLWYHDLHALEQRGFSARTQQAQEDTLKDIQKLQMEVGLLDVPVSYNDELYRLRSHINFVEALISRRRLNIKD